MKSKIFDLIRQERARQESTINLIASENYAPWGVLEVAGSVLTNKYAEGSPGNRFYAGCEVVDRVEQEAIDLYKKLFNAEYVNVQPHSGSMANAIVYHALLKPGDTILGMDLSAGGHLTHGYKVNFSGQLFNAVSYGVDPVTEQIDFLEIDRLARQHRPKLIIAGASAYARTIDFSRFSAIAHSIGALLLADISHIAGLVAVGLHPSPFPHADVVTATTHKTLRGPRGGLIFAKEALGPTLSRAVMPGLQGGPLMHIVAAKALAASNALEPSFKEYQQQILLNTKTMVDEFKNRGYRVVSGGSDNHLFLIDLKNQFLTGKEAEELLYAVGIAVNRNMIPFDVQSPLIASGIRLGTAAITTRGFKEAEARQLVLLIDAVLSSPHDEPGHARIRYRAKELCARFPVYL